MADAVRSIYRDERGRLEVEAWCLGQLDVWPSRYRRDVVTAAGARTHLLEVGGGADTVLVLAGDRFNAATNLPLLDVLSRRFRVVAVDVPGQPGLSAGWADAADGLTWYGRWIDDVVDQIGSSCLLLGHSFGGAVCLAARSPRVRARLALATGGLCRLRVTPPVLADFALWSTCRGPRTSRRLLRRLMGGADPQPREALTQWMTLVARHTRPVSSSQVIRPCRSMRTSVATGENDVFVPPSRLAPAVRNVLGRELTVLPGAGHLVTEEDPFAVLRLVEGLTDADR